MGMKEALGDATVLSSKVWSAYDAVGPSASHATRLYRDSSPTEAMPMKLYTWALAPNPRRVTIFMAEKGIEMPIEDVGDRAALKPDYLRKSTHRRVPVLELDDGTCIGEAMAICRYLEALHPEPPLFGRDPKQAALIDMWERYCEYDGVFAVAEVLRVLAPTGRPGRRARPAGSMLWNRRQPASIP